MKKIRVKEKQKAIAIFGIGLLFACWITVYITFIAAWFNGGKIIVDINHFGEGPLEIVIFSIVPFFGLYSIKHIVKGRESKA